MTVLVIRAVSVGNEGQEDIEMMSLVTVFVGPSTVAVAVKVVGTGMKLVRTLMTVTVMVTVLSSGGSVLVLNTV